MAIVLDLDGGGVTLKNLGETRARFDWNGDGLADRSGWIGAGEGLLIYDRNHDSRLSGADELSFAEDAPGARSDLEGLRGLDVNSDGILSALDPAFKDFRIWVDADGDGRLDANETKTLAQAGIASLSLTGTNANDPWQWGESLVVSEGSFSRANGTGAALVEAEFSYVSTAVSPDRGLTAPDSVSGILEFFDPLAPDLYFRGAPPYPFVHALSGHGVRDELALGRLLTRLSQAAHGEDDSSVGLGSAAAHAIAPMAAFAVQDSHAVPLFQAPADLPPIIDPIF